MPWVKTCGEAGSMSDAVVLNVGNRKQRDEASSSTIPHAADQVFAAPMLACGCNKVEGPVLGDLVFVFGNHLFGERWFFGELRLHIELRCHAWAFAKRAGWSLPAGRVLSF